jgi:hypothetical protein
MESPRGCSMSAPIYLQTLGVLKVLKMLKALSTLAPLSRMLWMLKPSWRLSTLSILSLGASSRAAKT